MKTPDLVIHRQLADHENAMLFATHLPVHIAAHEVFTPFTRSNVRLVKEFIEQPGNVVESSDLCTAKTIGMVVIG